jgi:hypothetical protein
MNVNVKYYVNSTLIPNKGIHFILRINIFGVLVVGKFVSYHQYSMRQYTSPRCMKQMRATPTHHRLDLLFSCGLFKASISTVQRRMATD